MYAKIKLKELIKEELIDKMWELYKKTKRLEKEKEKLEKELKKYKKAHTPSSQKRFKKKREKIHMH